MGCRRRVPRTSSREDGAEAAQDGAVFEICSRSVANHRLPPQTLPEWLTTVDAAIPAIARYTAEGWTYVKP